ncbi:hypothetical protein QPL79_01840 [Ignisphaera sp. 4213-co]|uniref:Uncharacterized protein n=1 Tax=Ignisphaera cupida TaxID=3050454 RepID=A0ABD4Z709_9CREN|nr:hypothetical protein [Ignisphaera sp. 4213-co]MDK6028105.1 hypothetical protein [Ignisphaera sp. 4213-co]
MIDMGVVISIVSTIVSIAVSIASLAYWLGKKFSEIDSRFKLMDERFNRIDKKFELIDTKFKQIDERFNQIDKKISDLENSISNLRSRMDRLENAFSQFSDLLISLLSSKGMFTSTEVILVKSVVKALLPATRSKYYTKEVYEKLKQLLDKNPEDYTMADIEELFRIADLIEMEGFESNRRDLKEYAWRLRFYAMIVRAVYIYPKIVKAEEKIEHIKR